MYIIRSFYIEHTVNTYNLFNYLNYTVWHKSKKYAWLPVVSLMLCACWLHVYMQDINQGSNN